MCSCGVVAAPSAVWAREVGPSAWGVKLASGGGVAGGIGAAPGTWGVLVVWTGAVIAISVRAGCFQRVIDLDACA